MPKGTRIVLKLTDSETETVIRDVAAEFQRFVDRYDERKYPPAELDRLRVAFRRPETLTAADIEAALVWKYGHTGKTNYPDHQRRLAARIAKLWPIHAMSSDEDAAAALQRWQRLLGPTSFITVCFLLHLASPETLPILDQHNFRSVNFHLTKADGRPARREKPGRFADLILVRDFIELVRSNWSRWADQPTPSVTQIDRYLMMHGKSLKIRNAKHRPNKTLQLRIRALR